MLGLTNKNIMHRIIPFCFVIFSSVGYAQSFSDASYLLPFSISTSGIYGNGVSVQDLNGDLLDDILVCTVNIPPYILINSGAGFISIDHNITNGGDIKSMSAIDYDNDGDKDIYITKYFGENSLWKNEGEWNFVDVTIESGLYLAENESFGQSWCDINRDGYLDLYICNYNPILTDASNVLFLGGSDGTFVNNSATTEASDGSNYSLQSVFFDSDLDGWLDLFVANDRTISYNHLYHNNQGIFTDISETSGLDTNIFSMSACPADFDNDGDFDIYISNNPTGNLLYRNVGNNQFVEVADELDAAVNDMSWSSVWLDFDNDGWQDLFVAIQPFWLQPGQNRLLKNENGNFINWTVAGGIWGQIGESYGAATGDFNNDGHEDLAVEFQSPNSMKILQNYGLEGNSVKLKLTGVISNRDAIGAHIELFAGGQKYIRGIRCGENYLGQNSQIKTFGIGELCYVDSVNIQWPSGIIDHLFDLVCDSTYVITEGQSFSVALTQTESVELCPGDSLLLQTTFGFESYLWSNGSDSSSIWVSQSGNYSVSVINQYGFEIVSDSVEILITSQPVIEVISIDPTCHNYLDGSIEISGEIDDLIGIWIEGDLTTELQDLAAGTYLVELEDSNGCLWHESIEIIDPEQLIVSYIVEGINDDGTGYIELTILGGIPPYEVNWSNGESGTYVEFDAVGNYTVNLMDAHGCGWNSGFMMTSINEAAKTGITISPNPVEDLLHVTSENELLLLIEVYTTTGRIVLSKTPTSLLNTIDMGYLDSGYYVIKTYHHNGAITSHGLVKK
jgi:hypothetical protein